MRNEIVEVKSLALVDALNKSKGMGSLKEMKMDLHDSISRPIYFFVANENVKSTVDAFIEQYGADDRSMDDWSDFDMKTFYSPERDNTVVTRNLHIVNEIINAGYAMNLCEVFQEPRGYKTAYKFFANNEILKIKRDGDAVSAKCYQEKMKQERENNYD